MCFFFITLLQSVMLRLQENRSAVCSAKEIRNRTGCLRSVHAFIRNLLSVTGCQPFFKGEGPIALRRHLSMGLLLSFEMLSTTAASFTDIDCIIFIPTLYTFFRGCQ